MEATTTLGSKSPHSKVGRKTVPTGMLVAVLVMSALSMVGAVVNWRRHARRPGRICLSRTRWSWVRPNRTMVGAAVNWRRHARCSTIPDWWRRYAPSASGNVAGLNAQLGVLRKQMVAVRAAKPAMPSGQTGGLASTGAATAILMVWQRLDNLPKITSYLQAKPWIKEIIVWNNGHAALPPLPAKAHVIVPLGNLRDYSKYQACALAKTEFCFYQDDDFTTAQYADQLWDAAQAHPHVITSATDTFTWSTNEFWSVFNAQLGLHAQFSWIGCGAIFPRALAVRHLKIMDEFFTEAERGIADVAFAWATNAVPVQQLQVTLVPLKSSKKAIRFSSEISDAFFHNMRTKTLKLLPRILAKYPMPPTPPTDPCYYVAAANDLTLCTSVRPFATRTIPFNINDANDLNRRTRMSLYAARSSGHRAHPFVSALEGGDSTWWESGAFPAGAVWGISSPKPTKITMAGSGPGHGWQVSRDGGTAEASVVLWGKAWDVQHNVTFTWAGGEPAVIEVRRVTYAD